MIDGSSMTVRSVSSTDISGGAGIAAFRLAQGLKTLGVDHQLVVQSQLSDDDFVAGPESTVCKVIGKLLPYLDPVPKLAYPRRHRGAWSCGFLPNPCLSVERLNVADIIHLHWINGGMLPLRMFCKISKPIIWTLHDSWPFTGGCHIPYECRGFEGRCGYCPQLKSQKERDLSRRIWERKSLVWSDLQMTIVVPSKWLASLASASSLFHNCSIEVIPNGLDVDFWSPMDKRDARRSLGLPEDARIFLFSAMGGFANWNKGGDVLRDCLDFLVRKGAIRNMLLVLCGTDKISDVDFFPVPTRNFGWVGNDEQKRALYAAADMTVAPSRSESLGYVVMESMACGTPCVGFSVGGVTDLIDHQLNGFLAKPLSAVNFAEGMAWVLSDATRYQEISVQARNKIVDQFCHVKVAKRYQDLYLEVLARHREES